MAQIKTARSDKYETISRWLGVNESPDGDMNLKLGEASAMTNFRITNDNMLQIRPGTANVANLLLNYDIEVGDLTTVLTESNVSTASFTVYPNLNITDGGILFLQGTPATLNYADRAAYDGYYWQNASGNIYRFGGCTLVHPVGTVVPGGTVTIGSSIVHDCARTGNIYAPITTYSAVKVVNGAVEYDGASQSHGSSFFVENILAYPYYKNWGTMFKLTGTYEEHSDYATYVIYLFDGQVVSGGNDTFSWDFYPVTVVPNTPDSQVRGIWSGRVGPTEYIVAACNGCLWSLTKPGDSWVKTSIGLISTANKVHMFGFDGKLYIINGSQYMVWDGTTLLPVAGYRPLVAVATPYSGGGTALQRINMLNGQRRVWFSPDGSHATFQLPETGIASVDYAKIVATGAALTVSSADLANGTATLSTNPAAGINTVEIGYTVSATLRSQIEAMMLSETFNGVMDNRVFLYGDGTNKAFYSDIDYNGQATAEYFPDLNVIHVGEVNMPLTSMVRHYDRLLAFKEDSAYSIRYDTITLVSGTVTAGFYCTAVNKGIGSAGYGQAVVVENHPRTLDGRSIYEWTATTSSGNITGDQRNAQRVSQKVQKTLMGLDIAKALAYFDKINHEYFIVENGIAIVQNTENGAWYIYRDFPAVCMIVYKDEVYFGTADGYIRHVSKAYMHDCGTEITAYWESGSMDFGANYLRKYSDSVLVGIKPESKGAIKVTVQTDRQTAYDDPTFIANYTGEVDSGFFSWLDLDFDHFSFNVNDKPQMQRLRIKVKNFIYYKLIFSSFSSATTATITCADIKVRYIGNVR